MPCKRRRYRTGPRISLAILSVLLAACDPVEVIYLEHPGEQPVRCEGGDRTTYEVLFPVTDPDHEQEILYEERHRSAVDPRGGALSTTPDRVSAAIVAGSLDSGRMPWIQFRIYCGDATDPLLVTPRITREDLKKMENRHYLYVVE